MQKFYFHLKTSWRILSSNGLILLIFLFVALGVDHFLNRIFDNEYEVEQRAEVTLALSAMRARLEENINSNIFLVYGMGAYIANSESVSQEEFKAMATTLVNQSSALLNMAIAPDFVIKWVYPLKGNEKILGLDYRKVPDQWEQAEKVKLTGKMVVAGPIKLIQGGMGLVARVPVFLSKDGSFWGLVSSVMDLGKLVDYADINRKDGSLKVALRGKDGLGAKGEVFQGDPAFFAEANEPVIMQIKIPSGTWEMAGIPVDGWGESSPFHLRIHLFSLLFFLVAALAVLNRSRNKQALQESEERLQRMASASHDALIMIDSKSSIKLWNPAAEKMFGYMKNEVMGMNMHELICTEEDRKKAEAGMIGFAETGTGPILGSLMEMTGLRKSGEFFPLERSVASFRHRGEWYAIGSLRDITERKNTEKILRELASIDSLTGLSNRRYFMEQAQLVLSQACRYNRALSMMMFDLDHFKNINDTYGHDTGDKVLQRVGEVVRHIMRQTDVIGRIGGEEFAVVLPETEIQFALQAAERFRAALEDEVLVLEGGGRVTFTASIGLTCKITNEVSLEELMKQADDALYKAKKQGRNRVVTYS